MGTKLQPSEDLSGWEMDLNSRRIFNKTMSIKVGSRNRGNLMYVPGSNTRSLKQKVRIETNLDTGDYTVYATGTKQLGTLGSKAGERGRDIPIYSFDASKNKYNIKQPAGIQYYDKLFAARVNDKGSSAKWNEVWNTDIRRNTYYLAEDNIDYIKADKKANKESFKKLGKLYPYKTFKNEVRTVPPLSRNNGSPKVSYDPPQTKERPPSVVDGAGASASTDKGSTSASQKRSSKPSRRQSEPTSQKKSNATSIPVIPFGSRPVSKEATRETPNSDIGRNTRKSSGSSNKDMSSGLRITEIGSTPDVKMDGFDYMRYPEGRIPNLGYDYIQITAYNYVATGLPSGYGQGTTGGGANRKRESVLYTNPQDVIQLPMVGSISETNAVSWTDDQVSEIKNIAAGIAYDTLEGVRTDGDNPLEAVGAALMDTIKQVQTAAMSGEIKQAIAAYFAGQAAGVPNILQRATGKMINNNLELLFNGPSLRTFNFAFQLRPRSESEAELCRRMIRSLKKNSAPVRSPDFMFLDTPMIFRIQYIYKGDKSDIPGADSSALVSQTEHPYMNRIKPCALTGLSVNYTPEGSYMTYADGGSMTGYDLSLTFKEIEPIYRDDQENSPGESMGY